MSAYLWSASVVAAIGFYVHTFIGGVHVVRPLLASKELPLASKWLMYYCWHITTVLLAFCGAGFAWLAYSGEQSSLVLFLSILTAVLSILSAWVAVTARVNPFRFPSTSLFGLMAIAGGGACLVQVGVL